MIPLTAAALAGVCLEGSLPQGPLTVSTQPADLGKQRNPCMRTEVGLTGGAALLVDTADFYGRIQLLGAVDGRVELFDERMTVDFGIEPFRGDTVIAPITVSAGGLGATYLGATYGIHGDQKSLISASTRLVLPTAAGYQNQRPLAADIGLTGVYQWTGKTQIHGGLTLYGRRMLGSGPAVPRAGLSGLVGLAWNASPHFGLVLDLPVSAAWTAPFDYLALSPGLRVGTGRWSAELGFMAPLVGGDRTLVAVDLRTAIRFD